MTARAASAHVEPAVRGRLTAGAPLAPLVWFKSGGSAEQLFEPADVEDLVALLASLDPQTPVMALGLGSNMIVRDGGVPGVVVRLGKPFAKVERVDLTALRCGGGASGILVSSTARDAGVAGLEFLRSIPGTVGGFVRMNGGAYGRETCEILVECDVVLRSGELRTLARDELGYSYRHSELPEQAVVVSATFRGEPGEPGAIQAEMDRIAASREATAAAQEPNRRIDLQESAGAKGLGVDRLGRLPRASPRWRASLGKALQLSAQPGQCDELRNRGTGRGSAAQGDGDDQHPARMGNPADRS